MWFCERSFGWWGEMVGLSRIRFAAGVCVLAAGLLMGGAGGAVAIAGPASSSSASDGDDRTDASGQDSKPASRPGGGVNRTHSSGPKTGRQPSTDAKTPKKEPGGTDTKGEEKDTEDENKDSKDEKDSLLVAAVPGQSAPAPSAVTLVTNAVTPVSDAIAPTPDAGTPVTNAVTPVSDAIAPTPNAVTPVTNAVTPVSDAIAPTPNAVTPVANAVSPVSDVIASVQDILTPGAGTVVPLTQLQSEFYSLLLGSDVIALIQDMLTPGAGAVVSLTQLESEFFAFLLGTAGMEPAVRIGGHADAELFPAADAGMVSQWRLVLSLAAILGDPLTGNAAGVGTLREMAASLFGATTPPPAPDGAISMGVQSFLRQIDSELLLSGSVSVVAPVALPGAAGLMILAAAGVLPVSLAALAALALSGAGGLAILTGAGVRVGYRQAKAGFAVRTSGIARFARPGTVPLGVVRSGSLVAVRPRALHVVRTAALRAGCQVDKVA